MQDSNAIFFYTPSAKKAPTHISLKEDYTDVFNTNNLIYLKPKIDPEIEALLQESMHASIRLRQFTISR